MKPFADNYSLLYPDCGCRLPSMLVNCGHECVVSASYKWDGMNRGTREFVVWQYTLSGRGAFSINGRKHDLPAGYGFLSLVPEESCYFLPEDSAHWEFLYLTISGPEAARIAGECRSRSGAVSFFAPDSEQVSFARKVLEQCRTGTLSDRYSASAAAWEFMLLLLKDAEKARSGSDEKLIRMVHDHVLKNIRRNISVDELADLSGKSRWHFSRHFRQVAGQSPHDYVSSLKMRMAVRQLQSSRMSIKEIAAQCGFEDTSYFCKVFKKKYAVGPSGFRSGGEK